jgi:hypothetical protein
MKKAKLHISEMKTDINNKATLLRKEQFFFNCQAFLMEILEWDAFLVISFPSDA